MLERGAHLIADGRREAEVAIVGAARTAEVGGAEAEDGVVGGMVTRAAVPVVHAGIGAELYHTERHCGTWESMSVASGTDERIHKRSRLLSRRLAGSAKHQ